ncbi:sodium/bile acid cotransporter 7-B-like isoform X1 [Centruroides vittatus]|uniref:sodium/bile acid cotransporter 7-B-like isoform X1 n=2 Tax=Centruroides vittatus TaxID=120091 RepID=UPI0035107D21
MIDKSYCKSDRILQLLKMLKLANMLGRNWFIFCICLAITFAWINPKIGSKGGYLKPEITVKYVLVVTIFLISGLSLKTEDWKRTIMQYNIHIFIQSFTLVLVPLLIQILVIILKEVGLNKGIASGFSVVGCMPPPVSSAVILTKAAGGNEAVAVFNSVLGSFLGIIVTPLLILITVGSSALIPVRSTISQLFWTIIFPLIIGQSLRYCFVAWINRNQVKLNTVGSCMLLLIIYTTFCDMFIQEETEIKFSTFVITGVIVILLQASLMYLVLNISSMVNDCSPSETIAILFCATHKSLTLGIPILKVLYNEDPQLAEISFPLLIYHPTQILFGSLLIPRLRKWIKLEWYKMQDV